MRLWSLHPRYLDTKGLLAAWREGLLAQQVLRGRTRGYRAHPQLRRFQASQDPLGAIACWLRAIHAESATRGYRFDGTKIDARAWTGRIRCTRGQLLYEWSHLQSKLRTRDAKRHGDHVSITVPDAHPLFRIVDGDVEEWEVR